MHREAARSSTLVLLGAFALLGVLAAWLLMHHYQNDFALSRWAKTIEILGADEFRFEYLGLIYPHLPIYLLIPFYWLPGLASETAPFLLSTLVAAVLLMVWNRHLVAKGYGPGLRASLVLLVGLHPLFLWSATSGAQNALSMVMFYLLYLAVSRLVHEQDARSFIALAFVLAIYFFIDERTAYLFIGLLPLIPLIVPRRMLNESLTSVYIMLSAPLVIVLLSWAYMSWVFQDDAWLFLTAPGSAFRGAWADTPYVEWLTRFGGTYVASLLAILVCVVLAFPVLLWLTYHSSRHALLMRASVVLIAHPVIAGMLATANYFLAHPVEILFLMLGGFMAGVVLLPRETHRARVIMVVLLAVGWIGGWIVFNWKPTVEMQRWQSALLARIAVSPYAADQALGEWLKINSDPLLMDDRMGYRAIAFAGSTEFLILPYSNDFKLTLLRRPLTVSQIAVPNPRFLQGGEDLINKAYPSLYLSGLPGYGLIYDTEEWRIYRRLPPAQAAFLNDTTESDRN
jgi:membrane protein XagC